MHPIICPYCGQPADLVPYKTVKPGYPGNVWLCVPCKAWVGVHKNGPLLDRPLGTLANEETRKARQRAHAAFDPLWTGPTAKYTRSQAYGWMAARLGISRTAAHIAMLDASQCEALIRHVSVRAALPRFTGYGQNQP